MEISRISNSSEMTSMNIVSSKPEETSKSEETPKAEPTSKEASASGNDEGKVQAVDMKNKYDAISKGIEVFCNS